MIKMIAIDLDGTLLTTDKKISQENIEALHYAHSQGVKIVICTGRPYLAMAQFVEEIGLNTDDDYVIVFNGAQVRRASDGEILLTSKLSLEDMEKWYQELTSLDLPLNPIDDDWVYEPTSYPEGYASFYAANSPAPSKVVDFSDFESDQQFNKLVITVEEAHLAQQMPKIDSALMAAYSTSLSHPWQLEVMAEGTNKGNAILGFADKMGISLDEIVAIGDQENDRSMLELPLHSVAMGNAIPAMKELAEYITDTNDNSGVAKAIYHYVK